MEMRRYIKHSAVWWILAAVFAAAAVFCAVKAVAVEKNRRAVEPAPLVVGEEQLDDYRYIDVQYMTEWIYRVTRGDGEAEVFYIAWDTDGYGYLTRLTDEQYAGFADIVAYTNSEDAALTDVPEQSGQGTAPLSADIPTADLPAADTPDDTPVSAPAPVRLMGIIRAIPEDYLADISDSSGMTETDFLEYYGDYFIDATMTPADLENGFLVGAVFAVSFAVMFLSIALTYANQLGKELKRLKKAGLLERAESEFHYLQGDTRADALVSTAFIYGRHMNLVLPLTDVLWVYRHEMKLLFFRSLVVQLMTYDGRAYALKLSRGSSRRTADAIVQAVAARNPEVLVGLTRENHRLYDQQVPRIKQQYVRVGLIWAIWIVAAIVLNVVLRLLWT